MHDERDLLEVLKFELNFLEKGGYGSSPREPRAEHHFFEDSPSCMNFDSKDNKAPCAECVLMQLVPSADWSKEIPCRHIPLDASGETLDSLYRHADQREIEETFGKWLHGTITKIEDQRKNLHAENLKKPPKLGKTTVGVALHENIHPKCANPACPEAFHWLQGGKLFRFFADPLQANSTKPPQGLPDKSHGVKHYWLCERCTSTFGLVYDTNHGVTLKLLWPELPEAEVHEHSSVT